MSSCCLIGLFASLSLLYTQNVYRVYTSVHTLTFSSQWPAFQFSNLSSSYLEGFGPCSFCIHCILAYISVYTIILTSKNLHNVIHFPLIDYSHIFLILSIFILSIHTNYKPNKDYELVNWNGSKEVQSWTYAFRNIKLYEYVFYLKKKKTLVDESENSIKIWFGPKSEI